MAKREEYTVTVHWEPNLNPTPREKFLEREIYRYLVTDHSKEKEGDNLMETMRCEMCSWNTASKGRLAKPHCLHPNAAKGEKPFPRCEGELWKIIKSLVVIEG